MTPDVADRIVEVRKGLNRLYAGAHTIAAFDYLVRHIESLEALVASPARPDPGREQVGRFHKDGPVTEKMAARKRQGRKGSQRFKTLEVFRREDATDDELHFVHGIGAYPHVAGTRREELIADGWPIVDSGRKRRTRAGDLAIVWHLEEDA